MSRHPLQRLYSEQGQSAWLDNLRREDISSGRLVGLIDSGIRGLTSNPTIFQKAIQQSNAYDGQIAHLTREPLSTEDLYWALVCTDIREALDLFLPIYRASSRVDGYVSVEIDPRLAHATQDTHEAALDLWRRIDRPNVMIKIPATLESLPAIRALIASGVNVNVTLIFGLERYWRVMNAYINGLMDRLDQGLPIDSITSVASFFISRVDTEVDRRLEEIGGPRALSLRGQAAISQARLAYEMFQDVFSSNEWSCLETHGARVQRPLWASTSTKNSAYPDTVYVDELIGPDSVNTLPEATIEAFCDHGRISRSIDRNQLENRRVWKAISAVGVDLEEVSTVLETEGIASFISSFEDLIRTLDSKRV